MPSSSGTFDLATCTTRGLCVSVTADNYMKELTQCCSFVNVSMSRKVTSSWFGIISNSRTSMFMAKGSTTRTDLLVPLDWPEIYQTWHLHEGEDEELQKS